MMFRLVHRLKKKHGAVLFAVIAVMALLIAMSTAAYYTARGSYNTVASSYNYSQLYLSAISSADMISAAIMNEPVPAAAGAKNNFVTVQNEIRDHLNAVNDVIFLKTSNLSSVNVNATTSPQDIITALAGATPAEPGVLDGLTVEIRVLATGAFTVPASGHDYSSSTTTATVDKQTGTTPFTYSITTTAYYRDNTITVQDIIKTSKVGTRTVTTPKGSGNGLPSDFNPNIATGQGQPGLDGKPVDPGREVIVNVTEIRGDAAFRNEKTYLGIDGHDVGNVLKGGLVSEGSLFIRHGDAQVEGTDNNWYVGGDLVMANANGNLNLGQNDLYVGGDFVLGSNGNGVTARDIYVKGDLYVLNSKTINASNLHVEGNIYYTLKDENGEYRKKDANTGKSPYDDPKVDWSSCWSNSDDIKGGLVMNSDCNLSLGGHIYTDGVTMDGTAFGKRENDITIGRYKNLSHGDSHSTSNGIGDYSIKDQTKNDFTVLTPSEDGSSYDKKPTSGSALDALVKNTGMKEDGTTPSLADKSVYPNYTAGQQAYDNKATIDFSALEPVKNSEGQVTGYIGEFEIGATGEVITVTVDGSDMNNAKDIQIDIPYVEDGFLLDYAKDPPETTTVGQPLDHAPWWETKEVTFEKMSGLYGNQSILHYNIDTDPGGKSMPIVLTANQGDGNFSWTGDSSAKGADVSVKGNGKVTFEMGNKNKETGEYEPFKVADADKYEIPTYVQKGATGQVSSVVGSESQVNQIGGADGFDSLSVSEAKNIPQQSNVMLVSNTSGKAFDAIGKSGVFCGYIYAPNGTLNADYQTNGVVINVGSVVISAYDAKAASYQVSLPSPDDMSDFIGAMGGDTGVDWSSVNGGGGGGGGGSGTPIETPITYSGFENWSLVGSNYVGDPQYSAPAGTPGEGEQQPAA